MLSKTFCFSFFVQYPDNPLFLCYCKLMEKYLDDLNLTEYLSKNYDAVETFSHYIFKYKNIFNESLCVNYWYNTMQIFTSPNLINSRVITGPEFNLFTTLLQYEQDFQKASLFVNSVFSSVKEYWEEEDIGYKLLYHCKILNKLQEDLKVYFYRDNDDSLVAELTVQDKFGNVKRKYVLVNAYDRNGVQDYLLYLYWNMVQNPFGILSDHFFTYQLDLQRYNMTFADFKATNTMNLLTLEQLDLEDVELYYYADIAYNAFCTDKVIETVTDLIDMVLEHKIAVTHIDKMEKCPYFKRE